MKVFVSKYALSQGIEERDDLNEHIAQDGTRYATGTWSFLRIGRDAHETREEAVAAAEAMRKRKLASLRKQIVALEAMRF